MKTIEARLSSNEIVSRYVKGTIYIIKERVNYFREGYDCNHTIVGFDGIEYEIFMGIKEFKEAMEE